MRSAARAPAMPAGDNPWDAPTLEWATPSPPPSYNFAHIPVVERLESAVGAAATRLPVAERACASTAASCWSRTLAAAEPQAREASPRNSIWPFWAAIATSVMLIWSIFTPWAVVWGSIPVAIALIGWFWPKGTPEDES